MVHSLIGLFCGVFGNAPRYAQLTHGVFDGILDDLGPAGDLHFQRGHTTTVYYNEVALGRWLETRILSLGVRTILGTVLQQVDVRADRIERISLASRYGNVAVTAAGFVNASGDAALTWAGRPSRAGSPSARSTAHSRSSSRMWTSGTSPTRPRWTPASPHGALTTGCSGAAGSPFTSPGAGPPC